jgi:peptide-methionine (S)-S-oxide reductase
VLATTSGYAGGKTADPTYREVSAGGTGHAEAVQVTYDPARVSYRQLLDVFWRNVDPFDAGGQFCDRGSQYRSAIFAPTAGDRAAAEASKTALEQRFKRPIATAVQGDVKFWPAEDYHQDYYRKNSAKYKFYRLSCRRDARLQEIWGSEATH